MLDRAGSDLLYSSSFSEALRELRKEESADWIPYALGVLGSGREWRCSSGGAAHPLFNAELSIVNHLN